MALCGRDNPLCSRSSCSYFSGLGGGIKPLPDSFLKTDKSWTEYRAITKFFAYRPTLAGRAIAHLNIIMKRCVCVVWSESLNFTCVYVCI